MSAWVRRGARCARRRPLGASRLPRGRDFSFFTLKKKARSASSVERKEKTTSGFKARARRGGDGHRDAREGHASAAEARTLMSVMDMPQFWSSSMQRNDCGSCSYCRGRRTEEGGRASGTAQLCAGKETRARLARRPGLRAGDERHRVERSNGAARPISRDAPLPRRRRPRPRRPRPARSGRSPGRTAGWPGWASATASPRAAARGRPEPPW